MGNIYSSRFLAAALTTGAPASYTVPAGKVAILKDISAASGTSGTVVQAVIAGIPMWLEQFTATGPGVSSTRRWTGMQVLNPGEVLELVSEGAVEVVASGYLLTAP